MQVGIIVYSQTGHTLSVANKPGVLRPRKRQITEAVDCLTRLF